MGYYLHDCALARPHPIGLFSLQAANLNRVVSMHLCFDRECDLAFPLSVDEGLSQAVHLFWTFGSRTLAIARCHLNPIFITQSKNWKERCDRWTLLRIRFLLSAGAICRYWMQGSISSILQVFQYWIAWEERVAQPGQLPEPVYLLMDRLTDG